MPSGSPTWVAGVQAFEPPSVASQEERTWDYNGQTNMECVHTSLMFKEPDRWTERSRSSAYESIPTKSWSSIWSPTQRAEIQVLGLLAVSTC